MGMNNILLIFALAVLLVSGCFGDYKEVDQMVEPLQLTSPAFSDNGNIPAKFTCDGEDASPQLDISGVPEGAKSLVLIMDDPDAPAGIWDHWIVWNIPAATTSIGENSLPSGAVQGRNGWGRSDYGGPCPPSGTHRYVFKLFALDTTLDLPAGSGKSEVEQAMQGRLLAHTTLTGLYGRG
jgi:Raf kinase inhibitor-like YbhB/YbcL family protein